MFYIQKMRWIQTKMYYEHGGMSVRIILEKLA